MLPVLRDTGCAFVTSAVESVDDGVLAQLEKGHTRADFERAVGALPRRRVPLAPTFVPFTPWTTLEGYLDLLHDDRPARSGRARRADPARDPAADSAGVADARARGRARGDRRRSTRASLTYPVDARRSARGRAAGGADAAGRRDAVDVARRKCSRASGTLAHDRAGRPPLRRQPTLVARAAIPYLNEPWYC